MLRDHDWRWKISRQLRDYVRQRLDAPGRGANYNKLGECFLLIAHDPLHRDRRSVRLVPGLWTHWSILLRRDALFRFLNDGRVGERLEQVTNQQSVSLISGGLLIKVLASIRRTGIAGMY